MVTGARRNIAREVDELERKVKDLKERLSKAKGDEKKSLASELSLLKATLKEARWESAKTTVIAAILVGIVWLMFWVFTGEADPTALMSRALDAARPGSAPPPEVFEAPEPIPDSGNPRLPY